MDAANTEFPDATFDVVMVQYVLSAVQGSHPRRIRPDPQAGRRDRPAQPGQRRGRRPPLHRARVAPLARRLGWRTDFAWALFARWAERPHGMQLIERRPIPPFGHFSLIRFRKAETAA